MRRLLLLLPLCAFNAANAELRVWPSSTEGEVVIVNVGEDPAHGLRLGAESLGTLLPGESRRAPAGLRLRSFVGGVERDVEVAAATPEPGAHDPEVLAFVAAHDGDVDAIIAAVRALRFEAYSGLLRGPRGLLWSGAGNAVDQAALLVAAARAAGTPARFAFAELDEAGARSLLATMFGRRDMLAPDRRDLEGLVERLLDPDWQAANLDLRAAAELNELGPEGLGALLAPDSVAPLVEGSRPHVWAQLQRAGEWVDVDPTGLQVAAEASAEALDAVPRHRVSITLRAEVLSPLFGLASRRPEEVAQVSLDSADLVGEPLVIRFDHRAESHGGLVFASVEHVYTPVLEVAGEVVATGAAFTELFSNFPGGLTVLSALEVEIRVETPGEESAVHRHHIFDRVGAGVRAGAPGEVRLPELGPTPSLSPAHRTLIHVATSRVPRRMGVGAAHRTRALRQAGLEDVVEPLQALLATLGEEADLPPEKLHLQAGVRRLEADLAESRARSAGLKYHSASGDLAQATAAHHHVLAWPARASVMIAESRAANGEGGMRFDVVRSAWAAVPFPGGHSEEVELFRFSRALLDKELEGGVARGFVQDPAAVLSWESVVEAAAAQGVQLRFASASEHLDLLQLELPEDAVARMRAQLGAGRMLLYPEAVLRIGEAEAYMWIAYDPLSGDAILSDPEGRHSVSIEQAFNYIESVYITNLELIKANAIAGAGLGAILASIDSVSDKYFGTKAPGGAVFGAAFCIAPALSPAGTIADIVVQSITTGLKEGMKALLHGATANIIAKISRCTAFALAYAGTRLAIAGVTHLTTGRDPPVHARRPQQILDWIFGPRWLQRARLQAAPVALHAVPQLVEGPVLLRGPSRFAGVVEARLPGGRFEGVAQVFRGEALLQEGPISVAVEAAHLDGGSLRGEAVGDFRVATELSGAGRIAAELEGGRLRVFAELEGEADWYTLVGAEGRFVGRGEVVVSGLERLALEGAAVSLPGLGFGGAVGELTLGEAVGLQIEPAQSLAVAGLPPELEVHRGEALEVELGVEASAEAEHLLSAAAAEGWDLRLDGSTLSLRAGPGVPAGAHRIFAWLSDGEVSAGLGSTVTVLEAEQAPRLELRHEPLWTQSWQGTNLPLSFSATLTNRGAQAHTYALLVEAPEDHEVELGVQAMHLEPGEQGKLFVNLRPREALRAPGEILTLALLADDTRAELSIPYPTVTGGVARFEPEELQLAPGEEAAVQLVIEGRGNAPGRLLVAGSGSVHAPLLDLPEAIEVAPGEPLQFALRARATPSAPVGLGYPLAAELRDQEVAPPLDAAISRVLVLSADNAAVLATARSVGALGRPDLEGSLGGVAEVLEALGLACDPLRIAQLQALLRSLIADLWDEPFEELRARLDAQADAASCETLDGAALAAELASLVPLLEAMRDHDFRLALAPAGALAQPGQPVDFDLLAEALGAQAPTLDLALEGVEGALPAQLATPGNAEFQLQADAPGRHRFRIVARPVEAPGLKRSVSGVLVVEDRWVAVAALGSDPPFAVPGAQVEVFADLINVANAAQELTLNLSVRRPDGSALPGPEALAHRLAPLPGVQRISLGRVSLYEEDAGVYALELQVRDTLNRLVPGGAGEGSLFVGLPFDARVAVEPGTLGPGAQTARVRWSLQRRPLPALPELGDLQSIERITGTAAGPNGLAIGPDGSIYFSNFGTERRSEIPGYQPGNTIGRVDPFGAVEVFAQVPEGPTGLALGPDGALYVGNVADPERVSRVDLADRSVSPWYDFAQVPEGGGRGENLIELVFGAQGTLFATDLFEPVGIGPALPGRRIYALSESEGVVGARNLISRGLASPTRMVMDPRSGDLIVNDSGNERLVRVNTVGAPEIVELYGWGDAGGLAFHGERLLAVDGETGALLAFETELVEGHTRLVGEPVQLGGGLGRPLSLRVHPDGDLVTTAFELDSVVRLRLGSAQRAPITLAVEHRPEASARVAEVLPATPVVEGALAWALDWPADQERVELSLPHALEAPVPGALQLGGPTRITYTHGQVEAEATLPPPVASIIHVVGVSPDAVVLEEGRPETLQVRLLNPSAEDVVYGLAVTGLPAHISADHPPAVEVPAGGDAEVDLELLGAGVPGAWRFTVEVSGPLEDAAVASVALEGEPVQLAVAPLEQAVRWGETARWTVTITRPESNNCRGATLRTTGLRPINAADREASKLVDYFHQPAVITKEIEALIEGPAGAHPVRFRLDPIVGCAAQGEVTGTLTVLDPVGFTVRTEPAELRVRAGERFGFDALISNPGVRRHSVTLSRCCGDWDADFDAGPHTLDPGQTLRVPFRLRAPFHLRGARDQRVEVEAGELRAEHAFVVHLEEPGETLERLSPEEVESEGGVARVELRLERPRAAEPRRFAIAVEGPLAHSAVFPAELESTERRTDFELRLEDLEGLAPGPWPLRIRAWPVAEPEAIREVHAALRVRPGGLRVDFIPGALALPRPGFADVHVQLLNPDHQQVVVAALDFEVPPELELHGPELVELPAGAARLVPIHLRALEPGLHEVRLRVGAAEARLSVAVADPALAPVIEGFEVEPQPQEGAPFRLRLRVQDADDPLEALAFTFDGHAAPGPEVELSYEDDGAYAVIATVTDPSGATAAAELAFEVANVAPSFDSEPPEEAVVGALYRYVPALRDPGADPLRLSLIAGPGALLEGAYEWRPEASGEVEIALRVEDGDGGTAEQRWRLDVQAEAPPIEDLPPSAPELLEPEDGAADLEAQPTLRIAAAMDPEGAALLYDYEIEAGEVVAEVAGVEALEWQPDPLEPGDYSWRARAHDGAQAGPWSETWGFTVAAPKDAGPDAEVAGADAEVGDAGPEVEPADAGVEVDSEPTPDVAEEDAGSMGQIEDAEPPAVEVGPRDAGPDVTADGGSGGAHAADDCGCRSASHDAPMLGLILLLLAPRRRRLRAG